VKSLGLQILYLVGGEAVKIVTERNVTGLLLDEEFPVSLLDIKLLREKVD
jgi:hypothetical protein